MRETETIPEEIWQAIIENNANFNDQFFYAVKTTGIFCRPSCKSRAPKRENVFIFQKAEQAIAANFRPCKRCKPTGQRLPDHEWVAQVTHYIDYHYKEKLTLKNLAEIVHGSPYHLHRTFRKIIGITPVEYIQQTRIKQAVELLKRSNKALTEIAIDVGIPNTPYFITLFKKKTGQTPADFRQKQLEEKQNESKL